MLKCCSGAVAPDPWVEKSSWEISKQNIRYVVRFLKRLHAGADGGATAIGESHRSGGLEAKKDGVLARSPAGGSVHAKREGKRRVVDRLVWFPLDHSQWLYGKVLQRLKQEFGINGE